MNIIEKFRAWKTQHPDEDYQLDEIHEFANSLDRGELLEVFEALDMPELDAPTGPGWWWHESLMGHIACYYVDKYDNEDGLFAYTVNGMTPVESFMGKWVKAITPKEAK